MSLAVKALQAIKSNYIGTVVRIAAQFFAQLYIMRALGPDLVGVFGYTLLLYGLLALVIDQGFGWSLIHGDFADEELKVVLSRLMLGSLAGMLLVYALSYPIERYLHSALAGEVFRYCAPSYLLIAVYGISQAKLRAELRFKEIQYATTGAYLVAYPVVGVGLAWAGCGVWALLAAWYVQAVLQFAIGFYFRPHSLALGNPFRPTKAGALGRQVAGINVVNWTVDNASGVFVGALGPAALGNFNAASMLSRTPALQLAQTLQTILFSTASAVSGDVVRIKRLYMGAMGAIAFLVVPAYGYALTHGDFLVGLVFGAKWLNAGGAFAAMAVGMVALAMSTLSGAILTATGGQRPVLYSQLACLALMALGLWWALDGGLVRVGLVVSGAYLVRLAWQIASIARRVHIGAGELLAVVKGPLLAAGVMALDWWPWPVAAGQPVLQQGLGLLLKLLLLLLCFGVFPRFFFCPPLVDVLSRFGAGRRLAAMLGLAGL